MPPSPLPQGAVPCVIPLREFVHACRRGEIPPSVVQMLSRPDAVGALACLANALGALEPLAALRPPACSPRLVFDDVVEVPPATVDPDTGKVVHSCAKAVVFCAAMHLNLVIDKLRVEAANLTAVESGYVKHESVRLSSFTEGFCPPGEAGDGGGDCGNFWNVEHLVLCPEAALTVRVCNCNPCSPALFNVHAEAWGAC